PKFLYLLPLSLLEPGKNIPADSFIAIPRDFLFHDAPGRGAVIYITEERLYIFEAIDQKRQSARVQRSKEIERIPEVLRGNPKPMDFVSRHFLSNGGLAAMKML